MEPKKQQTLREVTMPADSRTWFFVLPAQLSKTACFYGAADRKTLFFAVLVSGENMAENFDVFVEAITKKDCKALADLVENPSWEAQEQAVDIFERLTPEEKVSAALTPNVKGDTMLHVMADEAVLQILEMLPTDSDRRAALSIPNRDGDKPLDLMDCFAQLEAANMVLGGRRSGKKKISSQKPSHLDIVMRVWAEQRGVKTRV